MPKPFQKTEHALISDRGYVAGAFLLVGLALLALWVSWAFLARVTRYEVSDSARLEVSGAASPVEAAVAGEVEMSHMTLGQLVQAGDVLVELDARDQKLALKQEETRRAELTRQLEALRLQVQTEEAGLENEQRVLVYSQGGAEAQLRQARAEAALAAQAADRADKLRTAGLISEADAQKARAEAESKRAAAASMEQAELRLNPELQVRKTDRTAKQRQILTDMTRLQGDMAASSALLERLRYEIDRRTLRATVSGKITECSILHPGAHVGEGQQLGVILPPGKVQMVADFGPAAAFGKLHAGQHAIVRLNGFPWAQFGVVEATVSQVAGELHDGKVHVELALNAATAGRIPMQHGLPGTVEVEVERVTPAAMLLRSAGQAIGAH